MKKLLLLMLASLMSISAFAVDNKILVKSGDLSVLKESANAILEMDYTSTTWEDDDDYKTWCGKDYDERVEASQKSFIDMFNASSKGLKINSDNAKYKIIFKVKNLEQHQGGSAWGRLTISISGTIEIVEIATGKSVLLLELLQVKGTPDYAMLDRVREAFGVLAQKIFAIKK